MVEDATSPDQDLAHRASGGDADALAALYSRHRERLLALIRKRLDPALRGKLESEDILQSAFLQAVRHHDLTGRPDEFLPWIARVMENTIAGKARYFGRRKRSRLVEDHGPLTESGAGASPLPTPSAIASQAEERSSVERALDRLSASDRRLIRLSRIEGRTHHEIAVILDKKPEAVKKAVARALGRLTRLVSEFEDR